MAKKEKPKPRPDKYEKSTLAINGTFEQVIAASFLGKPKEKAKEKENSGQESHG